MYSFCFRISITARLGCDCQYYIMSQRRQAWGTPHTEIVKPALVKRVFLTVACYVLFFMFVSVAARSEVFSVCVILYIAKQTLVFFCRLNRNGFSLMRFLIPLSVGFRVSNVELVSIELTIDVSICEETCEQFFTLALVYTKMKKTCLQLRCLQRNICEHFSPLFCVAICSLQLWRLR